MTDDLAPMLGGLDGPRPLPEHLRSRLERAMAAEAMQSGAGEFAALGGPRPLPEDVRERLERVLAMRTGVGPHVAQARAERRAAAQRGQVRSARRDAIVAAAACFVLTATSMLLSQTPGGVRDGSTFASGSGSGALPGRPAGPTVGIEALQGTGEPWDAGGGEAGVAGTSSAGGAVNLAGGAYYYLPHQPPPYHAAAPPRDLLGSTPLDNGGPRAQALPPPVGEAVGIGIIPGDPVQAAGFNAYIDLLNQEGGAGGHRIDLLPAYSPGTIATVNLSTTSVAASGGAPEGMGTPLIEGLLPFDGALDGDVLSPGGLPERQAHLAVAAAGIPTGGSAVVYRGGAEPFASRVPAALESALRTNGVDVVHVTWGGAGPPPSAAADAVFLSLSADDTRTWLEAARVTGYRPAHGIWSIWSTADQMLVAALPDGVQVVAPDGSPPAQEVADLEARAGQVADARLLHGWLTAKWLAVAVWQGGTDSGRLAERLRSTDVGAGFLARYDIRLDSPVDAPQAVAPKPAADRVQSEGSFGRAL